MKNLIIALALFSSSAFADVRENGGFRVPLAVKVEYTSIGRGTDSKLKKQIQSLVAAHRKVGNVSYTSYKTLGGLEGESSYCIEMKSFELARQLENEIAALVATGEGTTHFSLQLSCNENEEIDPRE